MIDHHQIIEQTIKDHLDTPFLACSWSDRIIRRGKQRFALFNGIAWELLPFEAAEEKGTRYEYYPVIIDGRMFRMDPDEGRGGMLYLTHLTSRRGKPADRWGTSFLQAGWLYENELALTNVEIAQVLIEEIDAGHNILTTPPPGWA